MTAIVMQYVRILLAVMYVSAEVVFQEMEHFVLVCVLYKKKIISLFL